MNSDDRESENLSSKDSHSENSAEGLQSPRATKSAWYSRLVDACIPNAVLADPIQVFQARALVAFVLVLSFFALVGIGVIIAVEQTLPFRRIATILLIACMSISILLMRRTLRLREAGIFLSVLLTFIVAYVDAMNLSIEGPATILWLLPYAISAMLLGARYAIKIAFLSIALVIMNVFLLKLGYLPTSLSNPDNWEWLKLIMFMMVLSIVAVCIYGLTSLERQRQNDLTKEIQINREIMTALEKATLEAQAAAKSKELFLATMSHELRTPLNGVLGNAQLLAKELTQSHTKARVESISASGELLLSIINDVLDYSKFESQGVTLRPHVFDLSKCLNQMCNLIRPRVCEGVDLIIKGAELPVFINADSHRLSQVFLNLLSNAAKFTEQGKITLSLELLGNDGVEIKIRDTGSGISDENQEKLFQDFVQVGDDSHKHNEGTGLGLAITRRIIERMDGSIRVESSLGSGTCMTVFLPVDFAESPVSDEPSEGQPQCDDAIDFSRLRVLIVDDVEMNCMMLEGMLEALGLPSCEVEHDGSLAVERIRDDDNFDLILMDVRMPTMDGLEATRQIRQLGFTKPVIAVTANAFDEDRQDCLAAGMNSFLSKPVNMDELQRVMIEVLA